VDVGVAVGVGVAVAVGVDLGVAVAVGVDFGVAVAVGVDWGVAVGVGVAVAVGVGVLQAKVSLIRMNSPGNQSRFALLGAIWTVTVCGPNVAAAATLKGTVGLLVVIVMLLMKAGGQPASCGSRLLKVNELPAP
jgi:hypothetical protein